MTRPPLFNGLCALLPCLCLALPGSAQAPAPAAILPPAVPAGVTSPDIDPSQLTGVPFGSHSHWAQPWRAYLDTTPASTFLSGVGSVSGTGGAAAVPRLAAAGVRVLRVEVGWSAIDFDDPTKLDDDGSLAALLKACKAAGVRPLLLLNGNTGVPCPTRFSQATVAADVKAGDTSITFRDAAGFAVNRTGLTNVTGYAAGRPLFTAISANADGSITVTLSQPCPVAFTAGQQIPISTLKYAPFTADGSDDYQATLAGWQRYALTVATFARTALGTAGKPDGGFDLEVWNELTFGSDFLDAKNYGLPSAPDMTNALIAATSQAAQASPGAFAGVGIGDGFANSVPWPGASYMPPAITAIDKHPYSNRSTYADGMGDPAGGNRNALGQPDSYVPTYTQHFPEYYGTVIQTETLLRDASPLTDSSFSYAGLHGRNAQPGRTIPVWITEYRLDPDAGAAADEVGKAILRFYAFYLGKGATKACWFNGDGLLSQPSALTALGRVCAALRDGLDPAAAPRALTMQSVADTHGHVQFAGDGTAAHPPLYDRDVFAFLPFQVNAHRFVAPYYVMTRDVAKDLPPENFTAAVGGLTGSVQVSALDPATGKAVPVAVKSYQGGVLTLDLAATDAVRLLTIDDGGL